MDTCTPSGRMRALRPLPLVALVTQAACGWGPVMHITGGYAYSSDEAGMRTAIVTSYMQYEAPTGLRAFPDGGTPRIRLQGALVYYCDATAQVWRYVGTVEEPDMDTNDPFRIVAWDRLGFTLGVMVRAPGPLFALTRVHLDGGLTPLGRERGVPQVNRSASAFCRQVVDSLEAYDARRNLNGRTEKPLGMG